MKNYETLYINSGQLRARCGVDEIFCVLRVMLVEMDLLVILRKQEFFRVGSGYYS